jgi:Zn-dependent peptidase ImmA (M78 family)
MAKPLRGVNHRVLEWARQKAGQTIEDVAAALQKEPSVIAEWEKGEGAPTYVQLEKLAYSLYKRPLAIFFFPEPPDEPDPEHSFRTLPDFELRKLSPDTRYKVRKARAFQLSLSELNDGHNPADRRIFSDFSLTVTSDVTETSKAVRAYLGVDLQTQAVWPDSSVALERWRIALEDVGVAVFKDTFKQRDVSGFSLIDDDFPIIYVNNSTAFTRQIFTLFHELAHILLRVSGVTKRDDRYISSLSGNAQRVEVFCNRFAGAFLVPGDAFAQRTHGRGYSDAIAEELSRQFNVSREVILRRFLEARKVTAEFYTQKVKEWAEQREDRGGREGGGNYYLTQGAYLGQRYLRLAFSRYYQGRCTLEQLADYLNVKPSSIPGLESRGVG